MQLLDDDMDELFRNAASQYPLKTDGSDWDAVMRRLPQSDNKQVSAFNRLRDSRWLRWLLGSSLTLMVIVLCVPALRVGVLPSNKSNNTISVAVNNNKTDVAKNNSVRSVSGNDSKTDIAKITTPVAVKDNKADVAKNNSVRSVSENDSKADVTKITTPVAVNNNKADVAKNNSVRSVSGNDSKTDVTKITTPVAVNNNKADVAGNNSVRSVSENNSKKDITKITTPVTVKDSKADVTGNNNTISVSENEGKTVNKTNPPIVLAATDVFNLHLLSTADRKYRNISAQLQSGGNLIKLRQDTTVRPAKVKVPVQKGLYVGIVASPDFSTVKGQKVSNVGYNAGIIAGYRISRHLAVETGVLLERKYYYSEGKYFSTKKIDPPADMKIIDVDGWCKMIEIPLNVRYVVSIRPKSNWYVNAGVSSYIMSKESYDYKYERYNTISTRNWSYNNETRNWFSIIHAGVGYEHRLGGIGTLRVEPYLKMPAGGVGIGNLPLTSVGLNVGITRPVRF